MTPEQARALCPGLYEITWDDGRISGTAVGRDHQGRPWLMPSNWVSDRPSLDHWTQVVHARQLHFHHRGSRMSKPRVNYGDPTDPLLDRLLARHCTRYEFTDTEGEIVAALNGGCENGVVGDAVSEGQWVLVRVLQNTGARPYEVHVLCDAPRGQRGRSLVWVSRAWLDDPDNRNNPDRDYFVIRTEDERDALRLALEIADGARAVPVEPAR